VFHIEKLIQACNYLLKKNGFRLNYTKLIKLLYLADKEALRGSMQTITGDSYVSMDNGPVLSKLYDLIKGTYRNREIQGLWDSRFMKDDYDLIAATEKIPQGELSEYETDVLDTVYEQFKDKDFLQMIEYVHANCPEWKDPAGTSLAIETKDILQSLDRTPEEIEWALSEMAAFEEEDKVFSSLAV